MYIAMCRVKNTSLLEEGENRIKKMSQKRIRSVLKRNKRKKNKKRQKGNVDEVK